MRQTAAFLYPWTVRGLAAIVLTILGLIVVHAPLAVFFGSQFPAYELLIKGWKEILLLIGLALLGLLVVFNKNLRAELLTDRLLWLVGAYALFHLLLVPLSPGGVTEIIAGLSIDLRYVLFFVLVYIVARIASAVRRPLLLVAAASALMVLVFGILQIFVLPKDVLSPLGYGPATIAPYQTIDQNEDYIRINSTLRGPNPLGAYVLIVGTAAVAYLLSRQKLRRTVGVSVAGLVMVLSPAVLYASYSRSALVAAALSLAIVLAIRYRQYLKSPILWGVVAAISLVAASSLYVLRDTSFVQHVIVHRNPAEANQKNSNEGHVESLANGADRAADQPLGAGIGSTGSASLLGDKPLIIENQYLFIAHEAGWLGLLLFLAILAVIGRRLWWLRGDWLAVAILASGIGLSLIGLLQPVWADDTVSLIWWGLAGLALAVPRTKGSKPVVS